MISSDVLSTLLFFHSPSDIKVMNFLHHVQVMKTNVNSASILYVFLDDRKSTATSRFEICM